MFRSVTILGAFLAVLAVPPSLSDRVERLESLQRATVEKLIVTMEVVEAQEAELAVLRECIPECFPPEKLDSEPMPVPD